MRNLRTARRVASFVCILALVLCVCAESVKIRESRERFFPKRVETNAGTPPMVRFVIVALGGFRGILADCLWLRSFDMQEEGRYEELVQLSEWITALEPENSEVWSFHSWNLAYNVSVLMKDPRDAWRWVMNGLELLRDKGIASNPGSAKVRRELGWLFENKIAMPMDRYSGYYRAQLAEMVCTYLGPNGEPPPPMSVNAAELLDVFKMDSDRMAMIDERFGPLDWRVAPSHAVYWALEGLELEDPRESLPCARIVYQSLLMMMKGQGRLVGDPAEEGFEFGSLPNFEIADGEIEFIRDVYGKYPQNGVRAALTGSLIEASRIKYLIGDKAAATAYYAEAEANFGGGYKFPPLEDFVRGNEEIDWSMYPEDIGNG